MKPARPMPQGRATGRGNNIREQGQNEGTNRGTLRKTRLYLADSKERLGIIYAALVLLESVI